MLLFVLIPDISLGKRFSSTADVCDCDTPKDYVLRIVLESKGFHVCDTDDEIEH